jgi:hypothetical protein
MLAGRLADSTLCAVSVTAKWTAPRNIPDCSIFCSAFCAVSLASRHFAVGQAIGVGALPREQTCQIHLHFDFRSRSKLLIRRCGDGIQPAATGGTRSATIKNLLFDLHVG